MEAAKCDWLVTGWVGSGIAGDAEGPDFRGTVFFQESSLFPGNEHVIHTTGCMHSHVHTCSMTGCLLLESFAEEKAESERNLSDHFREGPLGQAWWCTPEIPALGRLGCRIMSQDQPGL